MATPHRIFHNLFIKVFATNMTRLDLLHCPLTPLSEKLEYALVQRYLDENETARYRASNIASSRLQLILSRRLIKQHMHELTGLPISEFHFHYTENGKPYLAPSVEGQKPIYFSLAHCHTSVAVAICDVPIGVDVENRQRNGQPWQIIGNIFNATVAERMAQLSLESHQKAFFFTHWTAMESMVKMKGSKVALERKHFALDFALPHNASYVSATDKHFYFVDVNQHELVAITCAKAVSAAQIQVFDVANGAFSKQIIASPPAWQLG